MTRLHHFWIFTQRSPSLHVIDTCPSIYCGTIHKHQMSINRRTGKENMTYSYIRYHIYTHTCIHWNLFSHKEQNYVICKKVDVTEDFHIKQSKSDSDVFSMNYRFDINV